ncbi:hypothetical protein HYH02_003280 [Chlamydomonas schloesseri]|uniref:serine C-palmitoyltransferase n=1 Tax=Chlamydomonas schloesseri TaxID=2026947 RepID=A0A836BA04_9CHLO|nr:hypothetical protein HYH02_003280 [Chlamydomonas schloesseri]|eukprot:KAG2452256.1 hypothetical protein HYH02_003280 [Chlamydomonas schloesseri]
MCMLFGRLRDILGWLLNPFSHHKTGKEGYAHIRDPSEDFYLRRMYGRIVDCWNRPICSAPDAWFDVMERKRTKEPSGQDVAEITCTGASTRCLNLASYNYLGFAASDPYCTPRVIDTIGQLGVSSSSPRILGGTTVAHTELEELVAEYLGVESAITYGMGFATNSSTIPALVGKGCLIMSDSLNHSSIVAGARQSGAKIKVFRHNDAKHLDALLRQSIVEGQPRSHRPWKKVLVIVEGVYSMEGETCNLKEVVEVSKRHKAYIYLDEAHSIGALGPTGRGCCEHWGVDPRDIDIMMGTFTKSFGSCGGYIAGKKPVIDFLRRHSPAHLYACAMAPGCVKQVTAALQVVMGLDGTGRGAAKVRELHDNANYVRARLLEMGLEVLGSWDSPVMPIMTYSPAKMVALSRMLLERRMAMVIVGFPATPLLLTRSRICISAAHSRADMDWALEQLEEMAELCDLRFNNTRLKAHMEAALVDHVRRHFGEAAAAAASVAGLASGAFDPYSYLPGAKKALTAGSKAAQQDKEKDGRKHGHAAASSSGQQQPAGSGPASPQAKRARKDSLASSISANGNGVAHHHQQPQEPAVVVATANGHGAITAEVEVQMTATSSGGKGSKGAAANGKAGGKGGANGFHRGSGHVVVTKGSSDVKAFIRTEALVS